MRDRRERRTAPRVRRSFPMRYRLIPVDGDGYLDARVQDLSPEGVRFSCSDTVRPKEGFLLELLIPDGRPVNSFGRAAWVRELPGQGGFEVGGRFVDQSTASRRAIERHIGR
ncbi:MAG TPA: PilZ domain-containing protein [Candidatus Methanoperedens sp.]|nr:PilZ domain-containing protein [Candidatus Methanoperedens sp.]